MVRPLAKKADLPFLETSYRDTTVSFGADCAHENGVIIVINEEIMSSSSSFPSLAGPLIGTRRRVFEMPRKSVSIGAGRTSNIRPVTRSRVSAIYADKCVNGLFVSLFPDTSDP